MVVFTAAAQSGTGAVGVDASAHTLDETYPGPGFADTVGGLDPAPTTTSPYPSGTARVGVAAEPSFGIGPESHGLDETYPGPGFADTVGGLRPDYPFAPATWSGPVADRLAVASEPAARVSSDSHGLSYPDTAADEATYIGPGFTETAGGLQPDANTGVGSVIPTSYFRKIEGTVYDENENPIESGLYVLATDNFSTAGAVDDSGHFSLYLLRTRYEEFVLIAEEDTTEGVDYIWYQLAGRQTTVSATETRVDLYFDRERVIGEGGGGGGLSMSSDVLMGQRPRLGGGDGG